MRKIHLQRSHLAELVKRPGGVARSQAVRQANEQIETVRNDAIEGLRLSIVEATKILNTAAGNEISEGAVHDLLEQADRIVTLSGTFGLPRMEAVAKSTCDLLLGMQAKHWRDRNPIAVHVRALQLVSPDAKPLQDAGFERLIQELAKILLHLGIKRGQEPQLGDAPTTAPEISHAAERRTLH